MTHRPTLVWAGAFIVLTALVRAAYAGFVFLLATILPPAVYAGFGLLYAAQTAMSTFAGVGIQETTIGRLKGRSTHYRRRALYRDAVGLFYVSASVVLIGLVLLASRSMEVTVHAMLLALVLGTLIAFATLQAALMRLEERHAASLVYSAGVPLLSCIGGIVGILVAVKLEAVFAGGTVGAALGIVALGALRHGYFATLPRRQRLIQGLQAVSPFAIVGLFGWLSGYGITFVVNELFEPLDVARYTFLFTVSSIAQMAASAMNMVWSPRFYRLYLETSVDTERQNRHFFVLQASGLGLIGAACVAILPWLGHAIGGYVGLYGSARVELALLFAGYVLSVPWWHAQNYYLVANQGGHLMRIVLWAGTAGMVAWLACMLVLGPIGVYVGFLLQAALKSLGAWFGARQQWDIAPPWAAIGVATALTFAALMVPGGSSN